MINFDAVDFSERRPEEVMFLLTLSVHYFKTSIIFYNYMYVLQFNDILHYHADII